MNDGGKGSAPRPRFLAAALVVATACQIYAFHGMRYDDPYITYRYGQNLALGRGLTFNPGQRFLGSTSPAHMLLAAAAYAVAGRDATPSVMSALGCVGWTAQAAAAYVLLEPVVAVGGALFVAIAIVLGAAQSYAVVPFETDIVAAFVLWALVAAQRKRWSTAAALSALAAFTRPDALILVAVIAPLCLRDMRARAWAPAGVLAVLLSPWIVFAWSYYGGPLPHTAVAKFQNSSFSAYARHIFEVVDGSAVPYLRSIGVPGLGVALVAFGAWRLARRQPFMVALSAYGLLHLCAYLVLRPTLIHNWHLYPLSIASVVLALGGLAALRADLASPAVDRVAGVLAVIVISMLGVRTATDTASSADSYWSGWRNRSYLQVARFLATHAKPTERFAAFEVGTLAYYTDMGAYDLGNLVTDNSKTHRDPAVRFIVLDKAFMRWAPPFAPEYVAKVNDFEAFVYRVPARAHVVFDEPPPDGAR